MWRAEDSEQSWQKGSPALPAAGGALSCTHGSLQCKEPILLSEAAMWGAREGTGVGTKIKSPNWLSTPGVQLRVSSRSRERTGLTVDGQATWNRSNRPQAGPGGGS